MAVYMNYTGSATGWPNAKDYKVWPYFSIKNPYWPHTNIAIKVEFQYKNNSGDWAALSTQTETLTGNGLSTGFYLSLPEVLTGTTLTIRYRVSYTDKNVVGDWEEHSFTLFTPFTKVSPVTISPSSIKGGDKVTVSWTKTVGDSRFFKQYDVQITYFDVNDNNKNVSSTSKRITDINTTTTTFTVPVNKKLTLLYVWVKPEDTVTSTYPSGVSVYGAKEIAQVPYSAPVLNVPVLIVQNSQFQISWGEVSSATGYVLERSVDGGDFAQVYSGAELSYTETSEEWSSVSYRIKATNSVGDGQYSKTTSSEVISATALTISGEDGDLGQLTSDVEFTAITESGNPITCEVAFNGVPVRSTQFLSGENQNINILDIPVGTGTIDITASTVYEGAQLTFSRHWTFTKPRQTFSNVGTLTQLTKDGNNLWPMTLAECVRIPGDKTLHDIIPYAAQIMTGSYKGTGTYGAANISEIEFPFIPDFWGIKASVDSNGKWSTLNTAHTFPIAWGKSTANLVCTYDNKKVQFYNGSNAANQFNTANTTYYYFAVKINKEG